jgi:prepilin-type N-terminal cleavage/methylation domain-containing protein
MNKGFTLIEVLISITIISFIFVGILKITSLKTYQINKNISNVKLLLESTIVFNNTSFIPGKYNLKKLLEKYELNDSLANEFNYPIIVDRKVIKSFSFSNNSTKIYVNKVKVKLTSPESKINYILVQ